MKGRAACTTLPFVIIIDHRSARGLAGDPVRGVDANSLSAVYPMRELSSNYSHG